MSRFIFNGEVHIHGFGIAHNGPEFNWTLRGMDESTNPKKTHGHIFQALIGIPSLHNIYAPSPVTFNSAILPPERFRHPEKRVISFNGKHLYRGLEADGVSDLRINDGYVMSASDCALLVVMHRKKVWAAHAGRNSLLDRRYIDVGIQSKLHHSVVDAIMEEIPEKSRSETKVFIGFTISKGSHFEYPIDHPTYGESNDNMLKWIAKEFSPESERGRFGLDFWQRGQIDIKWLIAAQCKRYGIREENIHADELCTYSDSKDGKHLWYSERRTKGWRNLFAAVRIS